MTDVEKRRKAIINVLYFAMITALGLLALRLSFGVCLPFAIAFIVAAFLQKPKNFILNKTPLKKGTASFICVMGAIIIFILLAVLIGVRVVQELKDFVNYIILQFQDLGSVIDNVEAWLLNIVASLPEFLRKTFSEGITSITKQLRLALEGEEISFPSSISETLGSSFSFSWITTPISGVISTAKQIPSFIVATVICIIACCFSTSEFPEIMNFIKNQFPKERQKDLIRAKNLLTTSLTKMCKAYLLIVLITFTELSLGFSVLRLIGVFDSNYIVIIAAITAIVDILPILGTGTILIPWALYSFITSNFALGIGLLIIYAVIFVIRQIIEPKLVAGQLGLSPIVTIAALYFGLKLFGVLGMFITPICIIMLKLLNDEGIIHLWKSPKAFEKNLGENK